jgi:DNA-binding transcriptional LysR family regulator
MLGNKLDTLLAVAEQQSFTKAADLLALTQPAVSHHISLLEEELKVTIFIRGKSGLKLTPEGEIVVTYAKRLKAIYKNLQTELINVQKNVTNLRIGITHTSESNMTIETLADCSNKNKELRITLITDTIKNLYTMLENYEIDLAIVDGPINSTKFRSLMLGTDYLVCVMSNNNPKARHAMVSLDELKTERMILRLPTSETRKLFESTLQSINESIDNFNINLEVDNIATIKDLVRKDLGVSILPKSACMDEIRKGKITALPIENLSMVRETKIIYNKDFHYLDILQEITKTYQEMTSK